MLWLGIVLACAVSCGGGGASNSGAANGVLTEGEGSAPTVLPPTDPGSDGGSPADNGGAVAVGTTAEFKLTLSLGDPIDGPKGPSGVPQYSSPHPISVVLELWNISGRPQTFLVHDKPLDQISAWHEASGHHVWPTTLHEAVTPYLLTFAPGERRLFGRTWFPAAHQLGRYRVRGAIATTDPRVPGALELVLDVR